MSISESTEKTLRLYMLNGISRRAVQLYFDQQFAPVCLVKELGKNSNKIERLCESKVISKTQLRKLKSSDIRSEDLDITLMIFLLRNIADLKIDDVLPSEHRLEKIDDIARIKFYRNHIMHALEQNNCLSDSEYTQLWECVCKPIKRLSKSLFDECEKLEESRLDLLNSDIKLLLNNAMTELLENEELKEKIESEILHLYDKGSDPIPSNIRIRIDKQLEEWTIEDDHHFIVTEGTKLVEEEFEKSHSIAIVGCFGIGKTAILRHVALQMRLKDYIVVPVTDPNEIQKYYNPLKKHVFVVDNFCGVCDLDEKELEAWNECGVNLNESLKLLVSIQLPVHKAIHVNMLTNLNFFLCNLQASDACLSQMDKASIARSYNINFDQIKEYIEPYNCFPRLCTYFKQAKETSVKAFFEEPFEVYETEINKLHTMRSKGKLCALTLLVMLNGRLPEDLLIGNLRWEIKYMLANTCDAFQLNKLNAHITIRKELENMIDTYIAMKEGVYLPLNEKIFNFLVLYFGNRITEHLIKYACVDLLIERFQFSAPSVNMKDYRVSKFIANKETTLSLVKHDCWERVGSNAIMLSDDKNRILYTRQMCTHWSNGNVTNSIKNPHIFHQFVFAALNSLNDIEKIQLLRKTDVKNGSTSLIAFCELYVVSKANANVFLDWLIDNGGMLNEVNNNGETALYVAASRGKINFVIDLLRKQPDINKCTNEQKSCLYAACQNGHSEVAELLVEAGADCNKCTNRGDAPLHAASRQGLTSVVKLLLKHNAETSQINDEGYTPIVVAQQHENYEIVQVFITHAVNG